MQHMVQVDSHCNGVLRFLGRHDTLREFPKQLAHAHATLNIFSIPQPGSTTWKDRLKDWLQPGFKLRSAGGWLTNTLTLKILHERDRMKEIDTICSSTVMQRWCDLFKFFFGVANHAAKHNWHTPKPFKRRSINSFVFRIPAFAQCCS